MRLSSELRTALKGVRQYKPHSLTTANEVKLLTMASAAVVVECLVAIADDDKTKALEGLEVLVEDMWKHIGRLCDERNCRVFDCDSSG
jgi:hypothetical protein